MAIISDFIQKQDHPPQLLWLSLHNEHILLLQKFFPMSTSVNLKINLLSQFSSNCLAVENWHIRLYCLEQQPEDPL